MDGGAYDSLHLSSSGGIFGGMGGNAAGNGGAGAGNPGGVNRQGVRAQNGTGGLLVVNCFEIIGNGSLIAYGSNGGGQGFTSGGSSGGGTINVFLSKLSFNNSINVSGGIAVKPKDQNGNYWRYGGAGGAGTATIGMIVGGYYTDLDI